MYKLPEKEENDIGRNQRSGRLRAEGAGVGRPGELRGALGASWASLFGLPPVWQRHHEPRWRELETGGLGGRPGHQEVVAAQSPAGPATATALVA